MESLIKLRVLGISRSQVFHGAYALLLEQEGAPVHVPIVVGVAEAQAIAISLEGVVPPRPLTHDLFAPIFHAFGIAPERVIITRFEQGMFKASMELLGVDGTAVSLDMRASDAVAIALRTGTDIYTTEEVLQTTGFGPDDFAPPHRADTGHDVPDDPARMTLDDLRQRLQFHIEREQYEQAAEIQKEINVRLNGNN